MRSIYLYLEIDKATLTEQGSKQVIIKAGENEAVKKNIKKHSLAVIIFSGKQKLNMRS